MRDIKEILTEVENGKLTSKEAVDILRNLPHTNKQVKYAKKIKIKIHDREDNRKINLPAIPIWVIEKFVLFGIRFSNYFYKEKTKVDENTGEESRDLGDWSFEDGKVKIDTKDLKKVFSVLRQIPPCKLVEVDDKDAFVEIHMI